MSDPAQEKGAYGDVDHGLGDVEGALIVPDQAPPADHPAECPLPDPTAREDVEPFGSERLTISTTKSRKAALSIGFVRS